MNPSDAELVRRARFGDREAFGALIERYLEDAYRVAFLLLGESMDAEDACHDAFLSALRNLESCTPERFRAWLMEIVRNRAHNLRRSARVRAGGALTSEMPAPARRPDAEAAISELRMDLTSAVNALSGMQRKVFALHAVDGMRHDEIASRLAISEQAARVHLHRARRALRRLLARHRET